MRVITSRIQPTKQMPHCGIRHVDEVLYYALLVLPRAWWWQGAGSA
jgi:hypothetical protein